MNECERSIHNKAGLRSVLGRIAPPIAFMLALCLLVVCCYEAGYTGLPPTEKRYEAAKARLSGLLQDSKKNVQREPWEKLADEFRAIYDGDPAWPNRPAVLYRYAVSLEELASRSCAKQDARKAISAYESLALKHASSRLADDALLRAAKMRAAWLKDDKGALSLLERLRKQYPAGDMIEDAAALEKAIRASSRGQAAPVAIKSAPPADQKEEKSPAQANFAGDLPLRYNAAKSKIEALRNNPIRACWREPWENLRDEFKAIYRAGKNRLAPAALFQAARCQGLLAACSRLSGDQKKAVSLYMDLVHEFPTHVLADDALLEAAKIQAGLSGGAAEARTILERMLREYPRGDMAPEGKRLLAQLKGQDASSLLASRSASSAAKTASRPELQVLSWDSPNRNSVQIVLEMSEPAKFTTRLEKARKGSAATLVVDLQNSTVIDDVRKGVKVSGSLLQAVRVRDNGKGSVLQFDFREVRKFDAQSLSNPSRIVLSVAAGKASLPSRSSSAQAARASASPKATPASGSHLADMASQLGLTVHRVFIDAGHGGKDPGASHNKVMERAISLDVAMTLGKLLKNNGLQVVYSRTSDKSVALSERTRLANQARADLFVSIHVNANDNPSVQGLETYYLSLASNPQAARVAALENAGSDRHLGDMQKMLADVMLNARADESRRLASDIQRLSQFRLKKREYTVQNNGVKSAPFHVLLGAQMPAVLVELGYCSNKTEAKNLANPRYRVALAEGIAEGILAYRDRLLRNRTAGNDLTGKKTGAM